MGAGVTAWGQADRWPSPWTRKGGDGRRQTASLDPTAAAQLSREGLGLRLHCRGTLAVGSTSTRASLAPGGGWGAWAPPAGPVLGDCTERPLASFRINGRRRSDRNQSVKQTAPINMGVWAMVFQ